MIHAGKVVKFGHKLLVIELEYTDDENFEKIFGDN